MTKKMATCNTVGKLWVLFFSLFSTASFAATYYVSPTGDDAGAGTSIATAWATITKVNSTVFLPGDALYFEGGKTFSGSIYLSPEDANDPNNLFIISSFGNGKAIINAGASYGFYAYNTQGFSVSNLIFDGNTTATNTGVGLKIFADLPGDVKFSNISISNTEIKNFGAEGVKIYTLNHLTGFQNLSLSNLSVHDVTINGIVISGDVAATVVGWPHKNVSVSNCEVYNVPGSLIPATLQGNGIVIAGVDGGLIQHCVAHDNGQNNTFCGGPGGIWSLESNSVIIQYCESYRNHKGTGCDGLGFDLDGGMNNSIMQYNYSHDNDGAGYLLGQYDNARPWNNNTVRYNISENDGVLNAGGIGLFKGPGTTMNGANIYNNTVFVSPQPGNASVSAAYFANWTTGINNVAFYNNIFFTTGGASLIDIPAGYAAFFAGNIYWSAGGSFSIRYQGTNYSSLAAWRAATGNEVVNGANTGFNSDPQLTNAGAGGTIGFGNSLMSLSAYKIRDMSSPAYHTALDLNSLYSIGIGSTDFWGTALSGGNMNDIGAGQFSSILPVKLTGFRGSCSGSENTLSWTTAEELNMKSFTVMYSGDAVHFISLADIIPKGNYSAYTYINDSASSGNNFYQLKMTDLDGRLSYSPIVRIHCGAPVNKISVWPNPFIQFINIALESKTAGPAAISLYDAQGKMMSQKSIQLQAGDNQLRLDNLNRLASGAFYLEIITPDGEEHFKLLKTSK